MILTLLASLAATPPANRAPVRAAARIVSAARIDRTGAASATPIATRIVRDPATGTPLRVHEFQ